jgi:putative membrane protein
MKTNYSSRVRLPLFGVSLLTLSLTAAVGFSQTTVRDPNPPARDVRGGAVELKRNDREFFEKAAKASMSEVEISRVAATRSSNPEVRSFAQMMIEDHQAASEELAALASAKGVSIPAKEASPSKWEKHDAKDFDRDYINKMVSDHEDVVKLFEKQAKDGNDADSVAFARKYLPKLQQHLQHASDLKRAYKSK